MNGNKPAVYQDRRGNKIFFGARVGNTYLRRYDTREEAVNACWEYIKTGVKPSPKKTRTRATTDRKATLKPVRHNAAGDERWDVVGRIGIGDAAKKISVGTFDSYDEALAKSAIFEQTGQTFTGRKRTISVNPKRNLTPKQTETPNRLTQPTPVNRWAERYGKKYY